MQKNHTILFTLFCVITLLISNARAADDNQPAAGGGDGTTGYFDNPEVIAATKAAIQKDPEVVAAREKKERGETGYFDDPDVIVARKEQEHGIGPQNTASQVQGDQNAVANTTSGDGVGAGAYNATPIQGISQSNDQTAETGDGGNGGLDQSGPESGDGGVGGTNQTNNQSCSNLSEQENECINDIKEGMTKALEASPEDQPGQLAAIQESQHNLDALKKMHEIEQDVNSDVLSEEAKKTKWKVTDPNDYDDDGNLKTAKKEEGFDASPLIGFGIGLGQAFGGGGGNHGGGGGSSSSGKKPCPQKQGHGH
jgi:hypothetical protein